MRSKGSKNHPVRTGQKLHVPMPFDAGQIPGLAGLENEANWLLHKIIFGEWLSGKPGWTRISRQTMEEFIRPANVATVLRSLRDAGVIVCDGDYLPAAVAPDGVGHSMGYGLAPAFDNTKLRTVEVTKTSLARKIKKHHADVGRFVKYDESVIEALMRGMKMTTIDRAEAYRKVSLHEFGKVPKHPGVGIVNRAAVHEKVIDTIDAGEMNATVCAYGRFHTEITRMLKGAGRICGLTGNCWHPSM